MMMPQTMMKICKKHNYNSRIFTLNCQNQHEKITSKTALQNHRPKRITIKNFQQLPLITIK